jgi:hypothetical protein
MLSLKVKKNQKLQFSNFSDLFNLPLPALWTVVLGENNRMVETGYEQRIQVDKIIMHEKYRHFKNDLGELLLKAFCPILKYFH